MEFITYEVEGQVGIITINRPKALNALNSAVLDELDATIDGVDLDAVRCLILTGAGEKSFVAGADIAEMSTLTKEEGEAFGKKGNDIFRKIETLPIPVIAAVNGFALGGGCELALACDFRIVSHNAQFGFPEPSLGILPGAGGTQRITRILGMGLAKEMILLGKNISSGEAVAMGLAYKSVAACDLYSEAEKMARKILARGPIAIAVSKMVLKASLSSSQEIGLLVEMLGFGVLLSTEDKKEGVKAFLEKRKPEFQGK